MKPVDRLEKKLTTLEQTGLFDKLVKTVRDLVKAMSDEGWELEMWGDAHTHFILHFDDEEQYDERDRSEYLPKFDVYLHTDDTIRIWFKESGEYYDSVEDAVNGMWEYWRMV